MCFLFQFEKLDGISRWRPAGAPYTHRSGVVVSSEILKNQAVPILEQIARKGEESFSRQEEAEVEAGMTDGLRATAINAKRLVSVFTESLAVPL